jgi:hypothetical protein
VCFCLSFSVDGENAKPDIHPYPDSHASIRSHTIHVGHPTGGGEVVSELARRGETKMAKAAII